VSQQQTADDVSVDEIPIDTSTTQSGEIEPADVPAEIESITRGLASEQPRRTHWSSSRRLAGGIFMEKVELIPRFSGLSSGCDILRPTRRATSSGSMRSSSISSRSASLTKRNRSDKQFCHSHRGVPGRTLPDRSVFDNKLCRRNESPSELVASDILPTAGGTRLGIRRESRATVATLIQGGRGGRASANNPTKCIDETHPLGGSVALIVNPSPDSTPEINPAVAPSFIVRPEGCGAC